MTTKGGASRSVLVAWLPEGGIEAGPEVDDPAQEKNPENSREDEEENGCEQSPLKELSEPGDKETRQRGDDITSGALAVAHGQIGDKVFCGCRDSLGKC